MRSLPLFHVVAGKPVVVVGDGSAGEARRRLVARAGAIVAGVDDPDARLAFVALDDPDAARATAARLRARGLLVNVADRPELCDFTVPALIDREPVLLAIGTGGASAGLAKWLRLRLEALLPAGLGRLAQALAAAREPIRHRWPDAAERRSALDGALAPGGALDPLDADAADRIGAWLDGAHRRNQPSSVEIRLRSDDPEDLSLREARLLGRADTIVHDDSVPAAILDRARADAVRRPAGTELAGEGLTVFLRR